ncbi:hypothetical protein PE36_11792 [Moritella sp. PE36]|uniref:DUF3466 family protein n=1 Tax=Moritella sp. PE36 TaxID=58051 RepID=UPI0001569A51|nr:DUF3466 family protein [Moritella sp. PE36]EDM64815.1 hypothetical protein PE36_11792 [Moritella sp. PE36]
MHLKKTKLAGIISLLLCSNAIAVTISAPSISIPTDGRFGPFVSAMDTSSAATATTSTAIYTNTYGQPFTFDIAAPWTYNEYCQYNDDVCKLLWEGKEGGDGKDGLYAWRSNILNTYNANYIPETEYEILGFDSNVITVAESTKVTAINSTGEKIGNITNNTDFTRRGFYEDKSLQAVDFTSDGTNNGGFSSVYDFTKVSLPGYDKTLIVGQSSVNWPNANGSSGRFNACFNAGPDYNDRNDYDDLYYCPGFNLQASYWVSDDTDNVKTFSSTWINGLSGHEDDATYIANAYAINTSGFAVGFSTQNIYNNDSGGRARATIFMPKVTPVEPATSPVTSTLSYKSKLEIIKLKEDVGSDFDKVIRDTVAIDITDTVYVSANVPFVAADGTDNDSQAFIVVGNRTFEAVQNRSRVTEFYTYDVASGTVRYPFKANPIKGATSQVSKINNDGLIVGWRDARGETSPREDGSARFQSAFIYDYKTQKTAYLDDLYCGSLGTNEEVRYRFANAISISDNNSGSYTIVANGFDYKNVENYKNRVGSTPVVLTMTLTADEIKDLSTVSQCPIKADEDYERSGAGMGWFILLPTMMLLFRRFKR